MQAKKREELGFFVAIYITVPRKIGTAESSGVRGTKSKNLRMVLNLTRGFAEMRREILQCSKQQAKYSMELFQNLIIENVYLLKLQLHDNRF